MMDRLPRGLLVTVAVCLTLSGPAEIATLMVHGLPALPASSSTAYPIGCMVGAVIGPVGKMLWGPVAYLLLRRRSGTRDRGQAR